MIFYRENITEAHIGYNWGTCWSKDTFIQLLTVIKLLTAELLKIKTLNYYRRIQRGFGAGQPVWDPKFLSHINKKLNYVKVISVNFALLQRLIDNYLTIFFLVNNPYSWLIYIFKTEKNSSKITIISFWVSGGLSPPNLLLKTVSPKNLCIRHWIVILESVTFCIVILCRFRYGVIHNVRTLGEGVVVQLKAHWLVWGKGGGGSPGSVRTS